MSWYIKVLKNYAVFSGRARRKEYWMFVLFNLIFSVVLTIIDAVTGMYSSSAGLGVLSGIYSLAVLVPAIAVGVRRLHDTNRSGWWLFIALVPFVGAIILIVFLATNSQPGDNKYGPNPKSDVAIAS
jgi:uncharacterized membrane protein YhaH (DUF805 family)